MDWEMMKHVNQLAINRENLELEKIRQAKQKKKDKKNAIKLIVVTFLSMLLVGLLGG